MEPLLRLVRFFAHEHNFSVFNALFALGIYLLRIANICPGLMFQSVGTSFINKLPLHSPSPPQPTPSPHLTQLLAGMNFTSPFMASLSTGPLSHQYVKEPRAPSGVSSARICDEGGLPACCRYELHRLFLSHLLVDFLALLLAPALPLLVLRLEHLLPPKGVSRTPHLSLLPLVTEAEPPTGSLQLPRKPGRARTTTTTAAAQQEVSATP